LRSSQGTDEYALECYYPVAVRLRRNTIQLPICCLGKKAV